jgi:hypothetical protein
MKTTVYYLGVAALFTHELDAVINAEWRLLFHLRNLPDDPASAWFIALHLPMFFAFFYLGHHKSLRIQTLFRTFVAIFLVIHSVLHFNLSDHPLYQFDSLLSNFYIFGSAAFGCIYLALTYNKRTL